MQAAVLEKKLMKGDIVLMLHQILRTGTFKNEAYGKLRGLY